MTSKPDFTPYAGPAGGWGSLRSVAEILPREGNVVNVSRELLRQNKTDGFACVSCAWAKPANAHPAEFCENGAKATAWELTSHRADGKFFTGHKVADLLGWRDYDLEQQGRLTEPLRYHAASDRYLPIPWATAFAEIGAELNMLDPQSVVFYASGRASLETSYMYGLLARMYGNNNLPDSSNMCHETTSVALKTRIGVPVGTTKLEDFEHCDAIFFFGQNVGSNAPRLLHPLRSAVKRGCTIVTFNPLVERGLERFTDPQNPFEMATRGETRISAQYHQVRAGGDIAVLMGMCKYTIEADDRTGDVLDHEFIAEHCHGFDDFAAAARATTWESIEAASGLPADDIRAAAEVYASAKRVIGIYGMGLTQHVHGIENVEMIVNLLLLRGNIGREGAGVCPVRGHSNVQGQRTVGISEKPELVPLDKLKTQFGFEPPRTKGLNTVEACEGVLDGSVKAFIGLGGNFLRAVPDSGQVEPAWRKQRLTVHVATKLNRGHLVPGEVSYILPCLGRTEKDVQATGPQSVSVEDSTSCIHGSVGEREPASPHLLSEAAIVAGIAEATLTPNPKLPWAEWVGDYSKVRDAIAETYPHFFADFNAKLFTPGGFYKGNKARDRHFETASGKAEFAVPKMLDAAGFADAPGLMRLITLRSNDQFNTTVYGYYDRFRGVKGTRDVLFISPADMAVHGLKEGDIVSLRTEYGDGVERRLGGLRVTPYSLPTGCIGTYYPEANVLIPLAHHAEQSFVLAAKSVPVRIERE
ncbi:FdhF/YdeP family oxidoreductase [Polymorphobacter sp. PAMC 29334]|uniref:FdhF/YdeP family oxidoreductase n=1 Tax=Polymorphobacter sp. PAMC 29334 TaxID=2862331 RepID=UPI001C75FD7E|nr:FdhF/YdeP family oxidoreductase [Polymorphobacter sp. PAMC 29334]QYE36107.1 FdhF/YdeP family oxidoreductase [Polymorphobacter sp. PAMC 29334]